MIHLCLSNIFLVHWQPQLGNGILGLRNTFLSDLGNLVTGSGCDRRVIRTFNIPIRPLFAFVWLCTLPAYRHFVISIKNGYGIIINKVYLRPRELIDWQMKQADVTLCPHIQFPYCHKLTAVFKEIHSWNSSAAKRSSKQVQLRKERQAAQNPTNERRR